MRLSIAMIVKNEESNIERTLKAIRKLDNKIDYEIIIVDTGSTDNTVNIAKKYTDKVYFHKWNGSFGDMRNISIKYCKGDWILILDADEVLEDEDEIVKFLNSKDSEKYNAAEIRFKNLISEDIKQFIIANIFRLFKKNKEFYYVGRIHEQPRVIKPYTTTNITVFHYGYSRESYELMQYKYERNRDLLLKDIENGVEPIYSRFQLAQTYSMANMHGEALNTIKEAYKLDRKRKDGLLNINVYHFYSRELLRIGNYKEASRVAKVGLDYCDSGIDFFFVIAMANSYMNEYDKAMEGYEGYYKIRDEKEKGTFKAKTLGGASLTDYSYCKLNDISKNYIILNYNNKYYSNVIKKYREFSELSGNYEIDLLYYCSLLKEKLFEEFLGCIKGENTDEEIQLIIDTIDKINIEEPNINIKEIINKIRGKDKKLDSILNNIYLNVELEIEDVNYKDYQRFKVRIFSNNLIKNCEVIEKIKECNSKIINTYLVSVIDNYEGLAILYKYSKERLLTTNLKDLYFLNLLDRVLLTSYSIDNDKYKELVHRSIINNFLYLGQIYKEEIIEYSDNGFILDDFYNVVLKSIYIIENRQNNKIEYIKDFKKLIKEYPEYLKILTQFTKDISNNPISTDMIKEKDNLLLAVENLFNLGNIDEGLNIIDELEKTFNMDIEIINLKGLGYYLKGNYNEALLNIGFVYSFKKDNFDVVYNLATILEEMNRKEESLYFYKKSINLCADENLKQEIELKVKN